MKQLAVEHYLNTDDGTKVTVDIFGIPRSTLRDYAKRFRNMSKEADVPTMLEKLSIGCQKPGQVFAELRTIYSSYADEQLRDCFTRF